MKALIQRPNLEGVRRGVAGVLGRLSPGVTIGVDLTLSVFCASDSSLRRCICCCAKAISNSISF